MPTKKRRHQSSLIRQLIAQPQRFQFFQALRLIELWMRRGGRSLDSVLRFKNSVSLRFPASQIEALSIDAPAPLDSEHALRDALQPGRPLRVRITPAFMGFLGIHGVLPYDYTETIAAQIHYDKNEGGRAFFDTYSHRSMTLFYRAWEKCRVEYRVDGQGRDGFLAMQLALAGRQATSVRTGAANNKPADKDSPGGDAATDSTIDSDIADEVVARYAALIRHRPMPAEMIAGVLSEYFGVPFRLESFAGGWETLRPDEMLQLGGGYQLGRSAMLGPRYWRRDLCARLWIGPLARADFDRFLLDGSAGKALAKMLALFAVPTVRFEVRPMLRAADVASVTLNRSSQLGRGAFLVTRPAQRDQCDTRYHIHF